MNFPNEIKATFNQNIILGNGVLRVYKDSVLFLTFTESDITVVGNYFTIDITNLFPDNGSYYINFNNGLFNSQFNETFSINDSTTWAFEIVNGEYDNTQYNSEFLIN